MYETGLGRFIGRDPIGYRGGINLYGLRHVAVAVDPFGRNEVKAYATVYYGTETQLLTHISPRGKSGGSSPWGREVIRSFGLRLKGEAGKMGGLNLFLSDTNLTPENVSGWRNFDQDAVANYTAKTRWKKAGVPAIEALKGPRVPILSERICTECAVAPYSVTLVEESDEGPWVKIGGSIADHISDKVPGMALAKAVGKEIDSIVPFLEQEAAKRKLNMLLIICADGKRFAGAYNLPLQKKIDVSTYIPSQLMQEYFDRPAVTTIVNSASWVEGSPGAVSATTHPGYVEAAE